MSTNREDIEAGRLSLLGGRVVKAPDLKAGDVIKGAGKIEEAATLGDGRIRLSVAGQPQYSWLHPSASVTLESDDVVTEEELEHHPPLALSDQSVEWLRTEVFEPTTQSRRIRVDLYDCNHRRGDGKHALAYRLAWEIGEDRWLLIFAGDDFACPASQAVDSAATISALVGFLSMRPGDTDREYFERYSPRQLEFAEEFGEHLALWGEELREEAR